MSAEGWEDVEWSRANMICYYARLGEAEQAYESLKQLLEQSTRENMLTVSPAGIGGAEWDIFAIDGNMAGPAGMAEMLLQAEDDDIYLLPCLPKQWTNGYFRGLCIPGAKVNVKWKEGKVIKYSISGSRSKQYKVHLTPP